MAKIFGMSGRIFHIQKHKYSILYSWIMVFTHDQVEHHPISDFCFDDFKEIDEKTDNSSKYNPQYGRFRENKSHHTDSKVTKCIIRYHKNCHGENGKERLNQNFYQYYFPIGMLFDPIGIQCIIHDTKWNANGQAQH